MKITHYNLLGEVVVLKVLNVFFFCLFVSMLLHCDVGESESEML